MFKYYLIERKEVDIYHGFYFISWISSENLEKRKVGICEVGNAQVEISVRRGFSYLLDYVTPAEIFQTGDREKKLHVPYSS